MTRTQSDDHGYGGTGAAYDVSDTGWCYVCDALVLWPENILAHSDRHTAARVLASEIEDAPYAELARELRRERDMRRGGRPE